MNKNFDQFQGLRDAWNVCVQRYLNIPSKEGRYFAIDDFIESLVDIKPEGARAIYSNFKKWEEDVWLPLCEEQLRQWAKYNPFDAQVSENEIREWTDIRYDNNYRRYHKILQLIQNSGIGFGRGKEVKTIDRQGFQDG